MRRFGLRRFRLCDWSVYYSGVRNAVLREAPEVRSDYFLMSCCVDTNHVGECASQLPQTADLIYELDLDS